LSHHCRHCLKGENARLLFHAESEEDGRRE